MSTLKSTIEAADEAARVPFAPTTAIPETDVQRAIEAVTAAVDAVAVAAEAATGEARMVAQTARAMAREAHRAHQRDNAFAILHAQVFN